MAGDDRRRFEVFGSQRGLDLDRSILDANVAGRRVATPTRSSTVTAPALVRVSARATAPPTRRRTRGRRTRPTLRDRTRANVERIWFVCRWRVQIIVWCEHLDRPGELAIGGNRPMVMPVDAGELG